MGVPFEAIAKVSSTTVTCKTQTLPVMSKHQTMLLYVPGGPPGCLPHVSMLPFSSDPSESPLPAQRLEVVSEVKVAPAKQKQPVRHQILSQGGWS